MNRTRVFWTLCGGLFVAQLLDVFDTPNLHSVPTLLLWGLLSYVMIRQRLWRMWRGRLTDRVLAKIYSNALYSMAHEQPPDADAYHAYLSVLERISNDLAVINVVPFSSLFAGTILDAEGLLDFSQPPVDVDSC